jgi:hypothetical protein
LGNKWSYVYAPDEVVSDETESYAIGMLELSFGWQF